MKFEELKEKIINKEAKISLFGLGQVGLSTALSFVNASFSVTGIDTNNELVDKLNNQQIPFNEKGLEKLLVQAYKNKKFVATSKFQEPINNSVLQ